MSTDDNITTVAQELCQLTPVELDALRFDYPKLKIPTMMSAKDAQAAALRLLDAYSVGDAVSLILKYEGDQ